MYVVVVNDPGDKAHPNPNYNPNYLTASIAWDVWPGQTDQLDTPLDPISGTGCERPTRRRNTPELLQVDTAVRARHRPSDTTAAPGGSRSRATIFGTRLPGTVTLTDPRAFCSRARSPGPRRSASSRTLNHRRHRQLDRPPDRAPGAGDRS